MNNKIDKIFVNIQLHKEMLALIDDYRFKNRIPSRAEAVRKLIEMGLSGSKRQPQKNSSPIKE